MNHAIEVAKNWIQDEARKASLGTITVPYNVKFRFLASPHVKFQ